MAALAAGVDDVWRGRLVTLEFGDGLLVISHVGFVQVAENADRAGAVGNELAAGLEFEIFGAGAGDIGIEIDAVGGFGFHGDGEAGGEPVIVIFEDAAVGV